MMENKVMPVGTNPSLVLEGLFAEVEIVVGEPNVIVVEMSGDEKSLKDIIVTQKSPDEVSIKGKKSTSNNITVINNGNRSSISMVSNNRSCVIIGGETVIVNGKVISNKDSVNEIKSVQIKITVPVGTNLDVYDVLQLAATGLNGKLKLSLSGEDNAIINGVTQKINVKCSGQSSSEITKATGDVNLSASGRSDITIQGNFDDVEVNASGQSNVTIRGNCVNIDANASGQSDIKLKGKASGKVYSHSSGQSDIKI